MSVDVLMATRRSSAVDHGPGRVEGDSKNAESDAPTRVFRHPELRYQRVTSKLDVASSSLVSRSIPPNSAAHEKGERPLSPCSFGRRNAFAFSLVGSQYGSEGSVLQLWADA
jgi:hypothetical protein